MQIEAMYDHGKLEFMSPVKLKNERFRVRIIVPDEEIEDSGNFLPEHSLSDFPETVQKEVIRMKQVRDLIMAEPVPDDLPEETREQMERRKAFDMRSEIRRDQGRFV